MDSTAAHSTSGLQGPVIVYDGHCPFCSRYVALVRLRESLGALRLLDAREGGEIVGAIQRRGLDLDQGMVLILDGQYYHGADCMHRIALLSTPSSAFNRVNAVIFRSATLSRLIYPVLRAFRNGVLHLLGRDKISAAARLAKSPPR